MATAYSSNLALALPVTGELSGTWGTTVNTQITNMLDEALGYQVVSVTLLGPNTLTIPDGTTGVARSIYIQLNGTGGGTVTVPTAKTKMYFVFNNTASAITFKVTGQTGVSIPAAAKMALFSNGADIFDAENYFSALTLGSALPVASGGTGITSFGTGVATWLGTPSSANLAAAVTDETGSGALVFATSPTLVTPALGSPSSVGTMPAFTLGGTVSGGGNNINNVVIGASSPLAGNFTTLTTSSTVTINGGTANGVAYLNGSKVLTTGTALTFDGTTLSNSTSGTPFSLNRTGAGTALIELKQSGTVGSYLGTSGVNDFIIYNGSASELARFNGTGLQVVNTLSGGTSGTAYSFSGSAPATSLTLDSSGSLGIGTSSPATLLTLNGNDPLITLKNAGTNRWQFGLENTSSNRFVFYDNTAAAYRLIIDSSGNLGLGVTPSAWNTAFKALELKNSAGFLCDGDTAFVTNNCYFNSSSSWIYKATDFATRYQQQSGTNKWFIAPSGTGGDPISFGDPKMTLDASGNLGVGTTSPGARIDSKITTPTANATANILQGGDGTKTFNLFQTGSSYNYAGAYVNELWYYCNSSYAGMTFGSDGAVPIKFISNTLERVRIDSSGNLLVGVTTANANGGVLQLKSGITFPATAVAATDANTLDDYEEGTWTPGFTGTVVGTLTTDGKYTKIGNIVYWTATITATTSTTAVADTAVVENFPFVGVSFTYACSIMNRGNSASIGVAHTELSTGATYVYTPGWTAVASVGLSGFYSV